MSLDDAFAGKAAQVADKVERSLTPRVNDGTPRKSWPPRSRPDAVVPLTPTESHPKAQSSILKRTDSSEPPSPMTPVKRNVSFSMEGEQVREIPTERMVS